MRVLVLILLLSAAVFAQSPAKLEFEVASIKPSPEIAPNQGYTVGCNGGPESKDPTLFRCTNQNLRNMLTRAYGIQGFQLVGPDWLRDLKFEFSAKVPDGATKEDLNTMIRNLLIDRFKLEAHHESREVAKLELTIAKGGPKLKESVDTKDATPNTASFGVKADADGYPLLPPGRPGNAMINGKARLFYPKWTMEQLARQIGGQLGKPVTDATGLKGQYDIGLYWSEAPVRAAPAAGDASGAMDNGPTLERAIQEQLGLRLQPTRGPVDFLVVDHAEKTPVGN
jgi:uncharacterized protein (TIGR03435 family)